MSLSPAHGETMWLFGSEVVIPECPNCGWTIRAAGYDTLMIPHDATLLCPRCDIVLWEATP